MKRSVSIGSILGLALLACTAQPYRPLHSVSDKVAPEFNAQALDGKSVTLASLRGQVVVLHIWAAWQCADELPGLDEIAARLAPRGVTVVAVSIDRDADPFRSVASSRSAWRLTLLRDPAAEIAKAYDPGGFPAAYVIDRTGAIQHVHHGVGARDLPVIEAQAVELSRLPVVQ